jgi:hypothetical protein
LPGFGVEQFGAGVMASYVSVHQQRRQGGEHGVGGHRCRGHVRAAVNDRSHGIE